MKLYEIADTYRRFLEAVEREEIPEEAIADTLESIEGEFDEKADNLACAIKNYLAEAEAIKAEEAKLAERRKAKEKKAESLKNYLSTMLQAVGKTKVETARNAMSFRKSEAVQIYNEPAFIEWAEYNHKDLLTFKAPTVNKTAIKQAIKEGAEISGVEIVAKMNLQIK